MVKKGLYRKGILGSVIGGMFLAAVLWFQLPEIAFHPKENTGVTTLIDDADLLREQEFVQEFQAIFEAAEADRISLLAHYIDWVRSRYDYQYNAGLLMAKSYEDVAVLDCNELAVLTWAFTEYVKAKGIALGEFSLLRRDPVVIDGKQIPAHLVVAVKAHGTQYANAIRVDGEQWLVIDPSLFMFFREDGGRKPPQFAGSFVFQKEQSGFPYKCKYNCPTQVLARQ